MYLRLVFCKQRVCGDVGCMQVAAVGVDVYDTYDTSP